MTGLGMGTADLIPGVSGGTIAFLAGVYEELINSIKLVTGDSLRLVLRGKISKAISSIPFAFLLPLVAGIFTAIIALSNIFSYLLKNQAVYVWSFFFGLVLISTFIVIKRVKKWDLSDKIGFLTSAVIAFFIVGLLPGTTPATLLFFFLSGMIAIVAMILPGISGSFILLLLGKYQQVLDAVVSRDFLTLFVFVLGAILGLSIFARILSWLFREHHDISVAILAGFMLGSIRKIWPWKEVVSTRVGSHGEIVPLIEKNILPGFGTEVLAAIVLAIIGGVIIYKLDKAQAIRTKK